MKRIFISSVQKEFAEERKLLKRYIAKNPAYRRFFDTFVFEEDVVVADRRTDEVYLDELGKSDIYLCLIGNAYGYEDAAGISPTEREFDEATRLGMTRLVFVLDRDPVNRNPKETAFLRKISDSLIRAKCSDPAQLMLEIYASLDGMLVEQGAYRMGPFDASPCDGATLQDIDDAKVKWFVERAKRLRNADLDADMTVRDILIHLKLMSQSNGTITNAAILLFGKDPQRFNISSEVKCAQWYGTERHKPILSYQIYKGTLFDMVDNAIAFVLAHLNLKIGVRREGAEAPREYDIPASVVSEAIINAVAHRDYLSSGSVQVELFSDRLVVRNPGSINPALKIEDLFEEHPSCPNNNLIADQLYQTKYIEKFGTGFTDLVEDCAKAGLQRPEIDTSHSGVTLTIWRNTKSVISGANGGEETTNKQQIKTVSDAEIIVMLMKFQNLSVNALANKLQIKATRLRYWIDHYKKLGVLRREGARKNGKWVVTENFCGCTPDGGILLKMDVSLDPEVMVKVQKCADKRGIPCQTTIEEILAEC